MSGGMASHQLIAPNKIESLRKQVDEEGNKPANSQPQSQSQDKIPPEGSNRQTPSL